MGGFSVRYLVLVLLLLGGCNAPVRSSGESPTTESDAIAEEIAVTAEAAVTIERATVAIAPSRDATIDTLLNNVSTQQLLASVQQLTSFETRNSYSATDDPARGIGAAREWISAEFQRLTPNCATISEQPYQMKDGTPQHNIVVELSATGDYAGRLVIGAHYDTRVQNVQDGKSPAPGANDNASGVAVLLETARLLCATERSHRVVLVAFSAEEQDAQGSQAFVKWAAEQGWQIDMMLNNDSVGGRDGIPQQLRLFAPEIASSSSGQVARYVATLNALYQPDFPLDLVDSLDRNGRYGDQRSFVEAGIPAVRLLESEESAALLNSPTDTFDKIDYNYLAQAVRLNLAVAANWTGAPMPTTAPTIMAIEDGIYEVAWDAIPTAIGYAVSLRPQAQLTYPEFQYVPSELVNNVTLTGLQAGVRYGISVAPLDGQGRLGGFSAEVFVVE